MVRRSEGSFGGRDDDANQDTEIKKAEATTERIEDKLCDELATKSTRSGLGAAIEAPEPTEPLRARRTRIGRYLVLNELGEGGMGVVYRAYDPELDRQVAIKLLGQGFSQTSRKRLERETRALARLSHPNVIQVYDAGIHEDQVFLAMELVEGQTLGEWCQGKPRPAWQEVVDAFVAAGQGLAAAHAKELIHRDIKPSNLLVGCDGRVRVADFGLAAAAALPVSNDAVDRKIVYLRRDSGRSSANSGHPWQSTLLLHSLPSDSGTLSNQLDERLTRTGTLMGTLPYMAPEQHLGAAVGPAADQYSLCVSLYQGLYGQLPFSTPSRCGNPIQWLKEKVAADVTAPPSGHTVPAWLHRVVIRGLAIQPEDRYPSVSELVAALQNDPTRQQRARVRLFAMLGASALVAAMIGGASSAWLAAKSPSCDQFAQGLQVWNPRAKEQVRSAFDNTDLSYASATFDRVSTLLDDYVGRWSAMRIDVCEKARGDVGQSESLRHKRIACLERRREQLTTLVELYTEHADRELIENAVQASNSLLPIDYCGDVVALEAAVPPPEDPALRARVEAVQTRVDRLEILLRAGRYDRGLQQAHALMAEIDDLDYAPLWAQVLYWLGRLKSEAGDDLQSAESNLRAALVAAAQARDDVLSVYIWADLIRNIGLSQGRHQDALELKEYAILAAERAGDDRGWAHLLSNLGAEQYTTGKYAEAKINHTRALAIRTRVDGPEHTSVAGSLANLGNVLFFLGDYAGARTHQEHALAIFEKALGPEHPHVAKALQNIGVNLERMGRYIEAVDSHRRALAIREESLGPEHPNVADDLTNLGNGQLFLGEYVEARANLERAVGVFEKALGPEHPRTAAALSGMGNALAMLDDHAGALMHQKRAHAIFENRLGGGHPFLMYTLTNMARSLLHTGAPEAAGPVIERALAIFEQHHGPTHPELVGPLLAKGKILLFQNQLRPSIEVLERALALNRPRYRSEIQLTLARALWTADADRERAVSLATQARDRFREIGNRPMFDEASHWLNEHDSSSRSQRPRLDAQPGGRTVTVLK